MTRPTQVESLMETAWVFSKRSTCARKHVGAVIAREGRIIASGYNGAPAGLPHCFHSLPDEILMPGGLPFITPEPCTVATHAEENAIFFAARHGVALDGATIFCTCMPCPRCARAIINAGITCVWWDEPFRDVTGMTLLTQVGIKTISYQAVVNDAHAVNSP
jgi:dCMP deaminase